ncbi:MAG TPA: hypothetical protein VFC46_14910, partial [Humisphaera sp.]|nr:hypothetical protein [Humisphaera sp.]
MHEHHKFRLAFIGAVLFGALAIVFSPVLLKLRHPSEKLTQIVNLKPGIDMVGGTSLVYEIKKPEGALLSGHLASDVAEALKRRVDPAGVRNLIWRPQGDTRLEIQMPLSPDAKNSSEARRQLREKMIAAEDALKATNVAPDAVIDAIENKNGKTQADLVKLAGGSKTRLALFTSLKDLWNQIQQAHQSHDAETEARLRVEYDQKVHPKTAAGTDARSPIEDTNLTREQLEDVLSLGDTKEDQTPEAKKEAAADEETHLAELRKKFADFPARLAAIQKYVDAATEMSNSKGAIDDLS